MTILHVSDPQFGEHHRFEDGSLGRHLISDLRHLTGTIGVPRPDLVIVSGDIAEKGMRAEYAQARAFIDAVCADLGLDLSRVVVVPGNHDVNWSLCRAYFAECDGDAVTPSEPYPRKWRHYRNFVTGMHGPAAFTEDRPFGLHRFDDLRLVVAGLNSTMRETHRRDDHYGWCGAEQLDWFAAELGTTARMTRVGVVHHNARRKAEADNENLRDEDELTDRLGPHLDLLLHGHTHLGREDRLADGTLVLATGSTAVTVDWRPADTPNQYQVLQLRPDGLTRWGRQWDGRRWIADPRVDQGREHGRVELPFDPPGWRPPQPRQRGDDRRDRARGSSTPYGDIGARLTAAGPWGSSPRNAEDDAVTRVEFVTRQDVGSEALIERRRKGDPPLDYLVVLRAGAPLRCVGVLDRPVDQVALTAFDESDLARPRRRRPVVRAQATTGRQRDHGDHRTRRSN